MTVHLKKKKEFFFNHFVNNEHITIIFIIFFFFFAFFISYIFNLPQGMDVGKRGEWANGGGSEPLQITVESDSRSGSNRRHLVRLVPNTGCVSPLLSFVSLINGFSFVALWSHNLGKFLNVFRVFLFSS